MDKELELFLKTVEGYLKRLPISERIDIIKELKSGIEEMQSSGEMSTTEILERLGSPKELAAGYVGDRIGQGGAFNLKKLLMVISFYSLTSLSGMFVVPCGAVLAGGFVLCGAISPIAGLVKSVGYLFGVDVPFVSVQFGSFVPHPLLSFPIMLVTGVLLLLLGWLIWKAVLKYIRRVSAVKRAIDAN